MPYIKNKNEIDKIIEKYENDQSKHYKYAIDFHYNTRYHPSKNHDDFSHIGFIKTKPSIVLSNLKHFKEYPHKPSIQLPDIVDIINGSEKSFEEIVLKRRSERDYNEKPISFQSLAKILIFSYGITGKLDFGYKIPQYLRASPSGGALYPLEIYPVVFNVESLENGIYHYNVLKNNIELLKKGNYRKEILDIFIDQKMIEKSNVLFVITGVLKRSLYKYRNRGLRFIYFDAGHLAENMYLSAVSNGLGSCALGGFYDEKLDKLLDIDGKKEVSIYSVVVGNIDQ
ncbi:MAG: SagB/ThcOx family dehydrogenase [Atribacterota bacterium]